MDFFGSEILAKGDFFGSVKNAGFFRGHEKKTQGFVSVLYFSSAQINNKISTIYCWCRIFFGYAKNVVIILDRQTLKLGFFWYKI